MKLLPIMTLVIAGAALAACGTNRDNRYNETAYADHNGPERTYDHEVVYRSYGYDDPDVVYVQPAYRVVPAPRERVIYYYD
ncbi:MAG TPA: hypothetical protein VJV39_04080 [Dongiaceae bacterium]|jgi:hypothetical protein|nr:hypothetical protein [Dongiaceae bacterium]